MVNLTGRPNFKFKLTIAAERNLFAEQFPEHDAEPVEVELQSSVCVDVSPVLRSYVRHGPSLWCAVRLRRRVVPPLGQAKVAYLPSVDQQKILNIQWCGLRPSVLGQDRSQTKKIGLGLGLATVVVLVLVLQVRCCVVKHDLVTLVVIMILKDAATFQVLFIVLYSVLGTSLLCRSTVVFTYWNVKSTNCLCLLSMVLFLVLLFSYWPWSC